MLATSAGSLLQGICAAWLLGVTAAQLYGINYGNKFNGTCLSQADTTADLAALKPYTTRVKTFGQLDCAGGQRSLIAADANGMKVLSAVWISTGSPTAEFTELQRVLQTKDYTSVVEAVCVGSETQFRGDITLTQLQGYVNQMRSLLDGIGYSATPICVVDAYPAYLVNSNNCPSNILGLTGVDLFLVNIYPFFGGSQAGMVSSFNGSLTNVQRIAYTCGGAALMAKVGVGESGWPTGGNTPNATNASPSLSFGSPYSLVQHFRSILPLVTGDNAVPYFQFGSFDRGGGGDDPEQYFGMMTHPSRAVKPGVNAALKSIWPNLPVDGTNTLPLVGGQRSFVSCYADNRTMRGMPFMLSSNVQSVEECAGIARAHGIKLRYVGLSWNSECWGGFVQPEEYRGNPTIDPSKCMFTCTGTGGVGTPTSDNECGTGGALAVYELANYNTSVVITLPSPPSPVGGAKSKGSWAGDLSPTERVAVIAAPITALALVALVAVVMVVRSRGATVAPVPVLPRADYRHPAPLAVPRYPSDPTSDTSYEKGYVRGGAKAPREAEHALHGNSNGRGWKPQGFPADQQPYIAAAVGAAAKAEARHANRKASYDDGYGQQLGGHNGQQYGQQQYYSQQPPQQQYYSQQPPQQQYDQQPQYTGRRQSAGSSQQPYGAAGQQYNQQYSAGQQYGSQPHASNVQYGGQYSDGYQQYNDGYQQYDDRQQYGEQYTARQHYHGGGRNGAVPDLA